MTEYDIVVIGGGVSAICFLSAYRLFDKGAKILLIRKTRKQLIPCSVPYLVNTIDIEKGIIGDDIYRDLNVDLLIDEVIAIDRESRIVKTASGKTFSYKKLVVATGTKPIKLNIPGIELENVFLVDRDYDKLSRILEKLRGLKRVIIVGAGFVGMEFADELADTHKVTVVEILDEALALVLDKEFGALARKELEKRGVKFILGASVEKILGDKKVEGVVVRGEKIDADAVIISVGIAPNTELLKQAGIPLDAKGHVYVDSLMRTLTDKNIYAVGDIVHRETQVTGEPIKAYFAPLATIEGRIAALGMLGKIATRKWRNCTMAFLSKIGNLVLGAVGITESWAKRLGIEYTKIDVETVDRHPGAFKDTGKIKARFIFGEDLRLIGAEAIGSQSVSEIINYSSLIIQLGLTAYDIIELQFATHPKVTPSPPSYPIHTAALKAIATKNKK